MLRRSAESFASARALLDTLHCDLTVVLDIVASMATKTHVRRRRARDDTDTAKGDNSVVRTVSKRLCTKKFGVCVLAE